jgi:hypothetical protein
MNRETDTILLQTIGKFIQVQVQLAVTPLLQQIKDQQVLIENLRAERTNVAEQIEGLIASLATEISRIERSINDLPKPEVINGKDGRDGKDAEPIDYDGITQECFNRIEGEIKKFSVKDGIDGKDGKDGKDADMDSLLQFIENYMKSIPIPANGRDGKDGRDGAGVVAAFRDSDGHLVLTLSNGTVKDIGAVHGHDGKDGAPGKDGRDGFSLEDFEVVQLDDRTIKMYFAKGDLKTERSFTFPVLIDRGVWRQGDYLKGDVVTFGGSMFIAQCDTSLKPESKDWRLAVKRGLNGSDGKEGPQGKQGPAGRDGRDLTQLGPDGRKWG